MRDLCCAYFKPINLAVKTHHLKNVQFLLYANNFLLKVDYQMSFDRAFVAEGCQVSQPAVTLGVSFCVDYDVH